MQKSIRKIASLCLAMVMVLSMLAMPAFAAKIENHDHIYETSVDYTYEYVDNETHTYAKTTVYSCTYTGCPQSYTESEVLSYLSHHPLGEGVYEYTFSDHLTGASVDYYRYTCRDCLGSFVAEVY